MVDQVSNSSNNSLLRAQQAAQISQLQRAPTIINQTRSNAVVPAQPTNVQQPPRIAISADHNLPRGSIVDKLV
ncbi:MAG: hypothetical protein WAO98_01935 [Alphaproteobacteria bacterium]